jgi:CRISPR system Cascade subunit CasD
VSALIIRLAGPLQSWGEHSAFTHRDTLGFPTRSGLIGLFAAAQGLRRGQPLDRYEALKFTVRIDRPGVVISDFHTVGGGRPAARTVPTAEGKHRSAETATIVTRRHYLSDAVFTVAVEGPDTITGPLAHALMHPHWPPFLGRRSCPPDQPLLLRTDVTDPLIDLTEHIPVPRRPEHSRDDQPRSELNFVTEGARTDAATVTELADVPTDFAPLNRRYRTRAVTIAPRPVRPELWVETWKYRDALFAYMEES